MQRASTSPDRVGPLDLMFIRSNIERVIDTPSTRLPSDRFVHESGCLNLASGAASGAALLTCGVHRSHHEANTSLERGAFAPTTGNRAVAATARPVDCEAAQPGLLLPRAPSRAARGESLLL